MAQVAERTAQQILAGPAQDLAQAIVHPEPAPRRVEEPHADGGILESPPEETLQPVSLPHDRVDAPRMAEREAGEGRHREQGDDGEGRDAVPEAGANPEADQETAAQRDPQQSGERPAQLVPPDRAARQRARVLV
jgi:hypothetical protein